MSDFRRLDDPAAFFFRPPEAPGRVPVLPLPDVRQRVIELREPVPARMLPCARDPCLGASSACPAAPAPSAPPPPRPACALPRASCSTRARRRLSSPSAPPARSVLPWIRRYGLDTAITPAPAPCRPCSALKLSDARRYSADDLWCMDRGLGLFAGLNVLPKTASLSSYSDRTTRAMNQRLLGALASKTCLPAPAGGNLRI